MYLANIVDPRLRSGVIPDCIEKLDELGRKPTSESDTAVRETARELRGEFELEN